MKIVLAPDSFKGSLSASSACSHMEQGIRSILPKIELVSLPMADGGEGTVEALIASTNGVLKKKIVTGPLGDPVEAVYGILGDGLTAVLEMAAASGLTLLAPEKRNPFLTTTFGTGELIRAALAEGCHKVILGIGGSATNDGGAGMAQALGIQFYDESGLIRDHVNGGLIGTVKRIDMVERDPALKSCEIVAACDVSNPLLGPAGATYVYGPQKGGRPEDLAELEMNMSNLADKMEQACGRSVRTTPGSGAAGGLGAGLMALTGARLEPGVRLVLEACNFREKIKGADLIVTGEGKVDSQTAFGKTVFGIAKEAFLQKIPVIVLAGQIDVGANELYQAGVTCLFSICPGPIEVGQAMQQAGLLLENSCEQLMRFYKATAPNKP